MTEERRIGGRFVLLSLAGTGASGEVHRAFDERQRRVVAVKILSGHLDGDHAEERFAREIRVLESIESPHVVGYVAHGTDDRARPFVAVEWLEGQDLAQRQRSRPLSGGDVIELVSQLGRGLDAIHKVGVVHRDIKPSNVFLTEGPDGGLRVTVIDLGVALVRGEPSLTHHGTMIGTPAYMAPEQVLGSELTSRTDVFALGVMLYELIAGEKPYQGADALTIVAKIALQDPPRLRELVSHIPPEVDAIVARAMAKEPVERFASATELAEALRRAPRFRTKREPSMADDVPTSVVETNDSATLSVPERRVVTAVFARFEGTELSRDSAETFDRIARQHGGMPRQLLSLARVAVFGGALSTGDEAPRAARAARALRRALQGVSLSIATGRARGGVGGLPGDAIERGARWQPSENGRPADILVDGPTARLLGDAFDVARAGDELRLMGERGGVEGVRTLLGRATPCVGRERELSQLEALFDEVEREPVARVAIVVAPAGAGKSRVRHEIIQKLRFRVTPPSLLFGRGSAVAEGASFGLVGSAIRAFARIREDDPPEVRVQKVEATIAEPERRTLTPLLARLGGFGDEVLGQAADGALLGDQLRDAFERWLLSLARERPVALVLEDVQWADAPSIALVDSALRNLADEPIFVLALARPEVERRFPDLWDARGAQIFRLAKLTRRSSLALVRYVAGDAVDPVLVERVIQRADGNAFYLEELIRAAVEQSSEAEDPSHVELPDTVLGMVQARLDALGAETKRLLEVASIFGEAVWPGAIAAVLRRDAASIDTELATLASREVVERRAESRFGGESEYAFRHALLREGAYELLPEADRTRAHLAAGSWLEEHGESDAYVLARHFDLGSAPARAIGHYRRAAEQALYGSDFKAVIAHADKAVACGAAPALEGQLLVLVAEAKRWSGDVSGALGAATRAGELLAGGSLPWFSAMRELVSAQGRLGQKREIGPLAERIRAVPAESGAEGAQIAALVPATVHLLYNGEVARADALADEVEVLAARAPFLEPRVRARLSQLRAVRASHHGRSEASIDHQLAALDEFEQAGDRRAGALVRSNLGFALLEVGDFERAEAVLREALVVATRLALGTIRPLIFQNLGATLAYAGRLDEALESLTESAAAFQALGDPRLEGASRIHLAQVHLERGDVDRAEEQTRLVLARSPGPMESVGAHAALAKVLLIRGKATEALGEAELAMKELARVGTIEEFEAFARLTHVEALLANEEREQATEALANARARIEARLEGISDPGLRKSLLERIPSHARLFSLGV